MARRLPVLLQRFPLQHPFFPFRRDRRGSRECRMIRCSVSSKGHNACRKQWSMRHRPIDLTAEAEQCVALLRRMGQRSDVAAYGLVVQAHVLRPDVMTALLELIE